MTTEADVPKHDLTTDEGLNAFVVDYCDHLKENLLAMQRLFFEVVIIGWIDPLTKKRSDRPMVSVIACPDLPLESDVKDKFAAFIRKSAVENDAFCVIVSSEAWRTVNLTSEQWHKWRDERLVKGESISMEELPEKNRAEHIWVTVEREGKKARMLKADIRRDEEGMPHAQPFVEVGVILRGRFTHLLPKKDSREFVHQVMNDLADFIRHEDAVTRRKEQSN